MNNKLAYSFIIIAMAIYMIIITILYTGRSNIANKYTGHIIPIPEVSSRYKEPPKLVDSVKHGSKCIGIYRTLENDTVVRIKYTVDTRWDPIFLDRPQEGYNLTELQYEAALFESAVMEVIQEYAADRRFPIGSGPWHMRREAFDAIDSRSRMYMTYEDLNSLPKARLMFWRYIDTAVTDFITEYGRRPTVSEVAMMWYTGYDGSDNSASVLKSDFGDAVLTRMGYMRIQHTRIP